MTPITSSGRDKNMLLGGETERCTGKRSSSHNEAKIKSTLKPNQRIIPIGVTTILNLFLVVATWYINSAYLSAKLMALPAKAAWVKCSLTRVSRQGQSIRIVYLAILFQIPRHTTIRLGVGRGDS